MRRYIVAFLAVGVVLSFKNNSSRTFEKSKVIFAKSNKSFRNDKKSFKKAKKKYKVLKAPKPKYINMGKFKITAYCPCRKCSEGYGRQTATGHLARAKHTIAVDPKVIKYGTKVKIGNTVYTAEDCGGDVKGKHIDVYFNSHSEVNRHGVKYRKVRKWNK